MKSPLEFLKLFSKILRKEGKKSSNETSSFTAKEPPASPQQTKPGQSQPIIRPKKQRIHIQVGLDFGTSATKAVLSQVGRSGSHAVDFGHKFSIFPDYCLPSVGAIDKRGQLLLGIEAARYIASKEWDSGFQRFKVIVAGNRHRAFRDSISEECFYKYRDKAGYDSSFTAERITAIYLAYAMHKTRSIIERLPEYRSMEIDLAFNICMPIDHIENNEVMKSFDHIFGWAERVEYRWRSRGDSFDLIATSYDEEQASADFEKRVFAIPEAVAEMASYLVSLRRQEGLHAIIDFGAGTTDLSICNLFLPFGESKSHWYAARNIPKGTVNIERLIASYITECRGPYCCTSLDVLDLLKKLGSEMPHALGTDHKSRSLEEDISREISAIRDSGTYYHTWGRAYKCLRKQTKWEKVQIFLTGGGAKLPFMEDVFSRPWWPQLKVRYPVSALPTPDDYDPGGSGAPFQRMSVAYGLARPKPQLEDYVLPGDVDDHTPTDLPPVLPDRDDLYPK